MLPVSAVLHESPESRTFFRRRYPDNPVCCFVPVQQVRILVEGMDAAIGTSWVVWTRADAVAAVNVIRNAACGT